MLPLAANVMETGSVEAELLDLMLRAGSRWVLLLLIGLSLVAVAVILERVVFFALERVPQQTIDDALVAMRKGEFKAAAALLAGKRSMPAAVARVCLENAQAGPASVEEHAASVVETERLRYERGLAFLGTLGNNAPFIGLFGTVLGIIRAFHDLSIDTGTGSAAVMAGIAEALVATGIGLLVALPAVAAYNGFVRMVETTTSSSDAVMHAILAQIKRVDVPVEPRTATLAELESTAGEAAAGQGESRDADGGRTN
jgi:biopolymer transport protein ExbB/TolQ